MFKREVIADLTRKKRVLADSLECVDACCHECLGLNFSSYVFRVCGGNECTVASTRLKYALMDTRDQDRLAYYRKNISEGRVDAKMGTRLLAYAADILLAWLIALIAFTAGIQILINGGLSKELGTLAKSMQDEAIASSLIHYTAEGAAETDLVRSERYVKAIYGYDGSEQPKDELFQYYCVYVSKGKEAIPVSDFNKNILKIDDADSFFELHGEYAVLKPENVVFLDNYYSIDKTAEGINLHKAIVDFYSAAHDAAWKQFREAEPYVGMLNETLKTKLSQGTYIRLQMHDLFIIIRTSAETDLIGVSGDPGYCFNI